ncbi:FtsX-like permease family protein [uncultured Draconibacterium sp.]|uniref:ABC transporter permease n=1 Tax=uncultured Draconibacterium sp. TaxID=1573823 RepID=UPI0032180A07
MTNIKLIFRSLVKDKTTFVINIVGFAFSLSICAIIAVYVLHESSYDKFHENYDKIYRVVNTDNNQAQVDYTIKDEILKEIPEVGKYCHVLLREGNSPIRFNQQIIDVQYNASVDNNFFEVFSFPLLFGNPKEPFDDKKNSLAISESISQKLFGIQNPIGEKVVLYNKDEYTVSAVFQDFPERSSIKADFIRNESYEVNTHSESHCENGKCEYKRNIFLTLDNKTDIDVVTEKVNAQLAKEDKFLKEVKLQPFKDIYLHNNTVNNDLKQGNLRLVKLLSAIALITLLLASINYINLSIAQHKKRIKEVGLRKTIGASQPMLIRSFLVESVVVTFISIIFACIITYFGLPFFRSTFNLHINLFELLKPIYFVYAGLFILVLGLINGFFPALIITSYNPPDLFQKRLLKVGDNFMLKNVLTTFQFAVSVVLIICVITIFKQLSFVKHADLGFKESYLLKLTTYRATNFDVLKKELLQSPYVLSAGYSSGIPGEINWGRSAGFDAKDYNRGVSVIGADEDVIKTFGFEILEGRDFFSSENEKACLVNETAMKKFGWGTWQDKRFARGEKYNGLQVVGVIKDFHFGAMYDEIEPLVISYQDFQKSFLTVRLSGTNVAEAMDFIKNTWNEVEPNVPINYAFYDTWFDSMYKKEEQLAKMVSTFAILAIVISCLGIFGQAILNTSNRIKEIGIRKVNGAGSQEIVSLINREFLRWVLLSLFIAIPVGVIFTTRWLENFAYKTTLSWWIFALAGVLALAIALLTVSWQSWRAATRNPVEALRYE